MGSWRPDHGTARARIPSYGANTSGRCDRHRGDPLGVLPAARRRRHPGARRVSPARPRRRRLLRFRRPRPVQQARVLPRRRGGVARRTRPRALRGVRSCDLRAVQIHDRVLSSRHYKDTHYTARRDGTLVIAVACGDPAATCFCASMGTGPRPAPIDPQTTAPSYDLLLTEVIDDTGHRFVAEIGTDAGRELADALKAAKGT